MTNSFTYYGTPSYNFIRLRSSVTYNVKFRHFGTDADAQSAGAEAMAQVILAPGRSDLFSGGTILTFDSFVVRRIEWDYIPLQQT